MTLQAQANSVAPDPFVGIGGVFFNLIDVAQGYTFDPILIGAVSRKNHGSAGPFDIDLLPPAPGIECRSGGFNGAFQIAGAFAGSVCFHSAPCLGTGSRPAAACHGTLAGGDTSGGTPPARNPP